MQEKYYLKISNAKDLESKKERMIYRFFEILPGFLSWGTITCAIFFSWYAPTFAAFFIIIFDTYWLLKTIYFSIHIRASFKKMRSQMKEDWQKKLTELNPENYKIKIKNWRDIYQLVILPFYKEDVEMVRQNIKAIINSTYPNDRVILVLASEERAGDEAQKIIQIMKKEFEPEFYRFLSTTHPKDLPEEIPGKGSNESWAAAIAKSEIIDKENIPYEQIILSAFDIDTQIYPQYFSVLTYNYLTCENPTRSSFQPIPIYNNNIWDAPSISRVVASSATFWHMTQQERPERLATFSSHSMSFDGLAKMGFWQKNVVSEDSRVFWQALLAYNAKWQTVPLYYPVAMDANLAENFWKTLINIYKQQRRWGWGVENIPYICYGFLKNKMIPLNKKLYFLFVQFEGFWSWATNALIIFILGWLPLTIGGEKFNITLLSYNLPLITKYLMTAATIGLLGSAALSIMLLPPKPKKYKKNRYLSIILQWLLLPYILIIFGAIPAFDSQTRMMLGKYMGFWVTPKIRKN